MKVEAMSVVPISNRDIPKSPILIRLFLKYILLRNIIIDINYTSHYIYIYIVLIVYIYII